MLAIIAADGGVLCWFCTKPNRIIVDVIAQYIHSTLIHVYLLF